MWIDQKYVDENGLSFLVFVGLIPILKKLTKSEHVTDAICNHQFKHSIEDFSLMQVH